MERLTGADSVRYAQQVTAFPAGITTGSTWDTALMFARGNALGRLLLRRLRSPALILVFRCRSKSSRDSCTARSRCRSSWEDSASECLNHV